MAAAAIVLALVAGIGVYVYASGADKRAAEDAGLVDALVATSDIAKGTSGEEVIQAGLVKMAKVARGSVPPSVITDPNSLVGKVTAARLDTKQFITAQTFVSVEDGGGGTFANAINKKDLVAISVNVDVERGVANQIAPGDRVNVAWGKEGANGETTWDYLLRDVKVLAVGPATVQQQIDATGGTTAVPVTPQPGLLTFETTPDDALRVMTANSSNARIYLVLLPPDVSSSTASAAGTKTPAANKAP